jgi:hypothetical protein
MFWEPNIQVIKDSKLVPGSDLRDVSKSNGFAVLLSSSHDNYMAYKPSGTFFAWTVLPITDYLRALRTQERLSQ